MEKFPAQIAQVGSVRFRGVNVLPIFFAREERRDRLGQCHAVQVPHSCDFVVRKLTRTIIRGAVVIPVLHVP